MVQALINTIDQNRACFIKLAQLHMLNMPNIDVPATHNFGEKLYTRQIDLSQGVVAIGKTHLFEHVFVLLKGKMIVVTADRTHTLEAGAVSMCKAGEKKLVIILEDCTVLNVHCNDGGHTTAADIEQELVADESKDDLIKWFNETHLNDDVKNVMQCFLSNKEVA